MSNIAHIIESLEFGGAEKVVVQLANNFSKNNHVKVYMTKREGQLIESLAPEVQFTCLHGREGNDFRTIINLKEKLRKDKIDIVHIHNWSVFVEATIAARLAGIRKIIHTIHGPYMSYSETLVSKLKIFIRHKIERTLSRFVSVFVPVSYAIVDYLKADIKLDESKIHVIHNGVKSLDHTSKVINNDEPVKLVMVGRIAAVKNHRLIIESLSDIINEYNVHLTIAGDGPDYQSIVDYAGHLLPRDRIEFLGFRNDIENILRDKDIFLLTSNYEGISIALLEAMSMGLPAIASDVGGIPETIIHNKTGLLFTPGNRESLTRSLKELVSDPEKRATMGESARQYFMEEFDEAKVIQQYQSLYAE